MVPRDPGPLRVLHAIHDFLPRHRAGSEIYAAELCKALASRYHVTVVCAEYDPLRRHGDVTWRLHDGLRVAEITNNWVTSRFEDTYRPPLIGERLADVLRAVQPHVLHVHSLLNLSFDLPAAARALGIPVVATLHDYTLVCASGGQRIHRAESHVCNVIDTSRCARCFTESPFHAMMNAGPIVDASARSSTLTRAARTLVTHFPGTARAAVALAARVNPRPVTAADIDARIAAARAVFDSVELFVAPSPSLGEEYVRLGIDRHKLRVSDYGFVPLTRVSRSAASDPRLRIGFVGTLVWHKGAHVLIEAVRRLPKDSYTLSIHGATDVFPAYVEHLRTLARGLPVAFRGGFTRDDIAGVYSQFDVLVVPSLWPENSPLVIHEAFMAGVPVVGARSGGITDLIVDGQSGLLYDGQDPSSLSTALLALIEDRDLLPRLARQSPSVKSIEQDAAEWDAVYAECLSWHRDT